MARCFREFVSREPLPLATLHDAILRFLRGRDDAVIFGAQAVNAYAGVSRMTQAVDVQSTRAAAALLLVFPDLKQDPGPVGDRLRAAGVEAAVLGAWHEIVASDILPEDDEY